MPSSIQPSSRNLAALSPVGTQTQASSTITAIKNYILTANLKPGDPLPTETEMCNNLGVSRSSVREAIRTLTALDIVEVRHGRGTFVGNVSMRPMVESLLFRGMLNPGDDYKALREIVEVRRALDLSLAQTVVEAWTGRSAGSLTDTLTEMEDLASHGKPFPNTDRSFHSQLLAGLDNQLFRQLTEAFWDVHTLISPRLGAPTPEGIVQTAKAHRAMLDAAIAGDVEAYCAAVVAHYEPILESLDSQN